MPRQKRDPAQPSMLEARVKTAPAVPAIREAVADWRADSCKGVTETTRILLNHWFKTDHRLPNGRAFRYYDAQREAIETLIYLYEVAGIRSQKELLEKYAANTPALRLLRYDDFPRYGVKMATGSGKTKVMSLAVAWQYFNAVAEGRDDFARTFLIIAPNVIVFERLRTDFAGGRIFRLDPVIPPALKLFWDFDCYVRGEPERASSQGALYLTNIQQFYDRPGNGNGEEPDAITAVLGPKPPANKSEVEDFDKRIVARGAPCAVINDEAHHTHDEESEWNKAIRRLHSALSSTPVSPLPVGEGPGVGSTPSTARSPLPVGEGLGVGSPPSTPGLLAQLDFSATPRHSKGALFSWTVYDYPLKQAIIDGIVKRPMKGVTTGIQERPSDIASVRYQPFLTAGVERWREYRDQLTPLGKKPILFVMMNDTSDADDVAEYLRTKYPAELSGDQTLVIHTDNSGEVSKRDLDRAREAAREVDDETSPVNAIVSVLMLREGWDVQNVTVVVGLRPYSSKANILPEQTIGRGLRKMFRELSADYLERVDVIGNRAFLEFVQQLEKEEDIELGSFEVGKDKLVIVTIKPDPEKLEMDIAVPVLTPILARKKTLAEEIAALDVASFNTPPLPRKEGDLAAQDFHYEGYDIITLQRVIERDYTIPVPQTSQEVISYYSKRIAQEVKLPSQFAALVPKVRQFLQTKAFGEEVNLDEPAMIKAISSNVAHYVTVKTFVAALRGLVVEELSPQLVRDDHRLSQTPAFPYSRKTLEASKTAFNLVPCENQFEYDFARFLNDAPDVAAFAKLPEQFGFAIEYTDAVGNLRYYEPDFVARLVDGTHYLAETKGREDVDVAHKDRAAQIWCENATLLTGTDWRYLKVPEKEFKKLQPTDFGDLVVLGVARLF